MTKSLSARFELTQKETRAFLAIDERLEPKLDLIAEAIDRFQEKSEKARQERFANMAQRTDLRDWKGELISQLGDKSQFDSVAKSARSVIDAIGKLVPWQQEQFASLLEAYGHPQIDARQSHEHIHPELRNYISILERIAQEAEDLRPQKNAGQPQLYTSLVESLILVCAAVGIVDDLNVMPTGSKGIIGRLLSLCLEVAGVPDASHPDHGKAVRNALAYIDDGEAKAIAEYAEWEESVRKNRGK
ncbi:hypothetical protein GCM10009096_19270 [Parasphingorhabdus litoris]|uniref:Uncharacterized protein n=2 Tax=Parasphingorhabdus litoris TaxID=394733 RepID=A0ABN1AIR1_9SPHN